MSATLTEAPRPAVTGYVEALTATAALGWAWTPGQAEPLKVELRLGAQVVAEAVADGLRPDLARSGIGEGRHAFTLKTPEALRPRLAELRVFARTAAVLPPETVASYLRTILELGETLSRALDEADAAPGNTAPGNTAPGNAMRNNAMQGNVEALAPAAHTLAGSAGLFGFQRLARLGQRFEHALQANSPEAATLAKPLATAIQDTQRNIQTQMQK